MKVFKYRSCKDIDGRCRDIDMLLSDKVYASPIAQLNDDFEVVFQDLISIQSKELSLAYKYNFSLIQKQWDELKVKVKDSGILSLSLSDSNVPNNDMLWTHYADEKRGFCIAYDVDKLVQSEEYLWLVNAMEVKYQETVPEITIADIQTKELLLQKMLGTKQKGWNEEHEYRLVYDTAGVKQYNKTALIAVYLGSRMLEDKKQRIIDGLKDRDVNIYEMTQKPYSYEYKVGLRAALRRKINNPLTSDDYEILYEVQYPNIETFYVYYKGDDTSKSEMEKFVKKFREMHATMSSSVFLFDTPDVKSLVSRYPISQEEDEFVMHHQLGMSLFDSPDDVI